MSTPVHHGFREVQMKGLEKTYFKNPGVDRFQQTLQRFSHFLVHYFSLSLLFWFPLFVIVLAPSPEFFP